MQAGGCMRGDLLPLRGPPAWREAAQQAAHMLPVAVCLQAGVRHQLVRRHGVRLAARAPGVRLRGGRAGRCSVPQER